MYSLASTQMDQGERANLEGILRSYGDGAQVLGQDGDNIVVYKPRRTTRNPSREPMDNKPAATTPSRENFRDELPKQVKKSRPSSKPKANAFKTTTATKKKEKTNTPRQTQTRSQPTSEAKDKEQSSKVQHYKKKEVVKKVGLEQNPGLYRNKVHPVYNVEQSAANSVHSFRPIHQPPISTTVAQPPRKNSSPNSRWDRLSSRIRSPMQRFKMIKFVQVALAIYIAYMSFAPGGLRDPDSGLFVDQDSEERTERGLILVNGTERAIVAASFFQVGCLAIARVSAWLMYPALVCVFLSKFRATHSFLSTTPLALYMNSDPHEVHVYCGWTILFFATVHTICHVVRWAVQGNLNLLLEHFSGLSGVFIITSCLLICLPMTIFRKRIKYEIRKAMHYLFLVFAGALCFHTPASAIPNGGFTLWVFGILLIWYFLDATICYFFMTEKIETTKFSVLPGGVRMTMNVSERFQKMGAEGGVCYVCLPWVAKNQWHAFSLFENPSNPAERQIFIQKNGDWTSKVHRILQRDTVRPAWIHGPFPSPYDNAGNYDNQILVASGIGITPALSAIRAHKDSRRVNLIWMVRDPHLLEFFLRHLYLDHEGWNLIFYTGKENLKSPNLDVLTNTNICIIQGRPKLNEVIPNIIFGIESGLGLPERYKPETRVIATEMLTDKLTSSERDEEVIMYASELGFHLPPDAISGASSIFRSNNDLEARGRLSESIMQNLSIGFRPWDSHEDSSKYVKNLDKKMVLRTWGMMYCGGPGPVVKALNKISEDYQLGLHIESFAY